MNLARKHFLKHQAQSAAEQATEYGSMKDLNAYELQLMQLNTDRNRLRQIQSGQHRNTVKAEVLPAYYPYIDGILQARPGVQDEIITQTLVWCIDVCNYDRALDIAEYVLKHDLKLPDRFERTVACFVVEEICDATLKQLKAGEAVDLLMLHRLEAIINDLPQPVGDMPDQVRAKLYLALGKATFNPDDPQKVMKSRDLLDMAVNLDDKCGGKSDLAKANSLLQKFDAPVS